MAASPINGAICAPPWAWSAGRLDPADHWYLPGYPLLAVPFTHLTHSNPFLFPDLAFLGGHHLAGCGHRRLACAGLALCQGRRGGRGARLGVAAGRHGRLGHPLDIDAGGGVDAGRSAGDAASDGENRHPGGSRLPRAFAQGRSPAYVPWMRPCCRPWWPPPPVWPLLRARPGWAATLRVLAAASGSGALAVGTDRRRLRCNQWMAPERLSGAVRLDRLRVASAAPALGDDHARSAADVSRWARPDLGVSLDGGGVCRNVGMPRGTAIARSAFRACAHHRCDHRPHRASYLCYRDLHPQGLWRFYNYHYFKWPLVVLALYTVFLVRIVVERRFRALIAAAVAVALLLPWRVDVVPEAEPGHTRTDWQGSVYARDRAWRL